MQQSIREFNHLLTSQLEMQRTYFESRLKEERESKSVEQVIAEQRKSELAAAIASQKAALDMLKKENQEKVARQT
jgi:hypothetical protein